MDITNEELNLWKEENKVTLEDKKQAMARFLFEKEILKGDPMRTKKFKDILINAESELAYIKAQDRLLRITSENGDQSSDTIPEYVMTFEDFCKKVPIWNDPEQSYVCFRDDPEMKDSLVQRVQKSRLCYIHAPLVLQHYLVSRKTSSKQVGMINIAHYIHDHFDTGKLEKRIFYNEGGDSAYQVDNILIPDPEISPIARKNYTMDTMKVYGPCLVSKFKVFKDFQQGDQVMFHGKPPNKNKNNLMRCHGMIMIGFREDQGKRYFLLQNWWAKKQFIEVDFEYQNECNPLLSYVETPQDHIPFDLEKHVVFFQNALIWTMMMLVQRKVP